jgi:hypothetical protein
MNRLCVLNKFDNLKFVFPFFQKEMKSFQNEISSEVDNVLKRTNFEIREESEKLKSGHFKR